MTNLQNMTNKLADIGVTLTIVTTQFGSKFVHIHCKNFKGISRTFICNTVSFTTAWSDDAILQDAEVVKYIEELLDISLSEDVAVNTGEQKTINDMNIDNYITVLKADKRINDLHIKNVITALYLNDSIKQDEKQLRKLIYSDRNFNGCKVTKLLINDLIATIKDNKKELFSLPDNVPVICNQVLNVNIETEQKQSYDILLNAFN